MKMKDWKKVAEWLKETNGTDVVTGAGVTSQIPSVKKIFLHFNWNMEKNGLMILLHEAGHTFQEALTVNRFVAKSNTKYRNELKRKIWAREVDAWERGEQIAKELNLDLDWKRFYTMKRKGLKSYESYNI